MSPSRAFCALGLALHTYDVSTSESSERTSHYPFLSSREASTEGERTFGKGWRRYRPKQLQSARADRPEATLNGSLAFSEAKIGATVLYAPHGFLMQQSEPQRLPDGWHSWTWDAARGNPGTAADIQTFEAHSKNADAAAALSRWIREDALEQRQHTVHILIRDGKPIAYIALRSCSVGLRRSQARRLGAEDAQNVPGSYVAYIARSEDAPGAGREALLYAASLARRVNLVQRTLVLVVDPYDEETERMWREAFGFWSTLEHAPNGCRRLYQPIPGLRE